MMGARMADPFETEERKDLRKAVAAIARDFGHEYFLQKARTGEKSSELWDAVGRAGFLGVNISEEYGGGGGGIYEMQAVGEELAAAGCPLLMTVVSPTICGSIRSCRDAGCRKEKQGHQETGIAVPLCQFVGWITLFDHGIQQAPLNITR